MKPATSCPMRTTSPYMPITSRIGVLTMGFSAAMYSRVLVGLMYCVASFCAKGSRHTSHPATRPGSTS